MLKLGAGPPAPPSGYAYVLHIAGYRPAREVESQEHDTNQSHD